jgi:hypothetical protein
MQIRHYEMPVLYVTSQLLQSHIESDHFLIEQEPHKHVPVTIFEYFIILTVTNRFELEQSNFSIMDQSCIKGTLQRDRDGG